MKSDLLIKKKFVQIPNYQKEKDESNNKNRFKITEFLNLMKYNPNKTHREREEYPHLKLSIQKCIYETERNVSQEKENNRYLTETKHEISKSPLPQIFEKNKLISTKSRNKNILSHSKGKTSVKLLDNNNTYIIKPENCGYLVKKCLEHRINWKEINDYIYNYNIVNFKWQQNIFGIDYSNLSKNNGIKQMVNHYEFHYYISNKANLFQNLLKYTESINENIFKYIPFTILFEYENGKYVEIMDSFDELFNNMDEYIIDYNDINLLSEKKKDSKNYANNFSPTERLGSKTPIVIPSTHYEKNKKGNLWILKAPDLNRGRCIKLINSISSLKKDIKNFNQGIIRGYENEKNSEKKINENTYKSNIVVVQKYIEKPLLYFGRKFDIRIWVLLTHKMEVYMFNEGHLKICSIKYNLNDNDPYSHLTNYSFQKKNINFSKYEYGNEVSFDDLQYNIDCNYHESKINFKKDIIPKIKEIIELTFKSVKKKINIFNRHYTFEIFGFDFMLDENFNPFLIEVNTNPGLEESSPLIKMLVPRMIDDALRLTIDDIFTPVYSFENNIYYKNKMNFIYQSPFPVKGYFNSENLFKFICCCGKDTNDKSNHKIKYKKLKIKKYKLKDV